jgi:hypothetical protein
MTIVNRRNAVVGWATLKAGKVVARRQTKRLGSKVLKGGAQRAASVRPSRTQAVVAATATAVTLGVVAYRILRSGD